MGSVSIEIERNTLLQRMAVEFPGHFRQNAASSGRCAARKVVVSSEGLGGFSIVYDRASCLAWCTNFNRTQGVPPRDLKLRWVFKAQNGRADGINV